MTRIRPATENDAHAIAALCGQLGYPSTAAQILERLAELARQPDRAVLVLESNSTIQGIIQVSRHVVIESGAWAEIDALVIDEAARGAGLGRTLVAEAAAWARARGLTRLRVRTNELRTRTHSFYEREGFVLKKSQRVYEREA